MNKFEPKIEQETNVKDISSEFLSMSAMEFLDFLRSQRKKPALSVIIDWKDVSTARRLKAFLEDSNAINRGQKRTAVIRATEEQYKQELNIFASGVKWEKI